MLDEHVELLERVVVEQELDPLARGQLALGVLCRDALLAAAQSGPVAAGVQAGEDVFHGLAVSCEKLVLIPHSMARAARNADGPAQAQRQSPAASAAASNSLQRASRRAVASRSAPQRSA